MRSILILLFLVFSSIAGHAQDSLRIMTFNIRYDNPSDGIYSWAQRKEKVFDVFHLEKPHLAGLQEVLQNQEEDLLRALPGYKSFGAGRDDGIDKGEHSLILYDSVKYQRMDGSTFWLSEHPMDPGSISWKSACTRIVTWAMFRDRLTQEEIFFFNTHFDHVSRKARVKSAEMLMDSIVRIAGTKKAILTGDFNAEKSEKTYRVIINRKQPEMLDSRSVARTRSGPENTFVGFPAVFEMNGCIDFIFLSQRKDLKVASYRVVDYNIDGQYPSDHLPVIVEILKF